MKRPFYRNKIIPPNGRITSSEDIKNIEGLQERIFRFILIEASIVGAIAVIVKLFEGIPQKEWGDLLVYFIAFLVIVLLTFVNKIPYKVRAYGFFIIAYIIGFIVTVENGIAGNGRVWLIGISVLAAILLGINSGITALLLSASSLLIIGFLMNQGIIAVPSIDSMPNSSIFLDWVNSIVVLFLLGITLVGAIAVLIRHFNESMQKQRSMTESYLKDREVLDYQTNELDKRLKQIRTVGEISRTMGSVLDPTILFQKYVDMVQSCFDLYFAGVFLVDDQGESVALRAGTGEVGQKMAEDGFKLVFDDNSNIGWTIKNRRPRIEADMESSPRRLTYPLFPMAHSEINLPLIGGDRAYGALTLLSEKFNAFDDNDVTVLRGVADSLGITYQNARLFQQQEKNLQEISSLNRQYTVEAWAKAKRVGGIDQYVFDNNGYRGQIDQLASMTFPLSLREQVVGFITLEMDKPSLSLEELAFVEQVTTQAALAMENVRLLEETQRRAGQDRQVADVVQKARASTDPDTILRVTLSEISHMLNASEGVLELMPMRGEGDGNLSEMKEKNQTIEEQT